MTTCVVCGGSRFHVDRSVGALRLGHCRDCGLAFSDPLEASDDATVGEAHSALTDPGYNRNRFDSFAVAVEEAHGLVEHRLAAYERLLGRPPTSILEVGCGPGALGRAYAARGIDWQGIELNPESASFAQDQGLPVINVDFLGYGGPAVDIVAASQVLEHVLDPKAFLEKSRSLLRPGGIVHLDVPNHAGLASLVRRIPGRDAHRYGFLQPPYHLIAYSPKSLHELFDRCGFDTLRLEGAANTDPTWGQLLQGVTSPRQRTLMKVAGLVHRGSILTVAARPRAGPSRGNAAT